MLIVKEIKEQDIEKVHRLEKEIFTDPWSCNSIRESLEQKYTVLLGAWIEEELAGYLIFYFSVDDGEIARIAVDKKVRRQGVAGTLLTQLEYICKDNQLTKILLDVRESNNAAIGFYKSRGFSEDGIRKKFYANPTENAILMSRRLGK